MDAITASCRPHKEAYHKSGGRPTSAIKVVVLHDTEGGTASSVANYFTSPGSGGSAQLVLDDSECFRCLPDTTVPWGAPGANTGGVHLEFCGYAHWSAGDWHHHEPMLHRGAFKVAAWCRAYSIPVTLLSPAELRAGHKGIVTHKIVDDTYHLSTHTDPGPGFPLGYFLSLVNLYLHPRHDPPPPVVKHLSVAYTDKAGQAQTRGWWNGQDLLDFLGRVAENSAPEDPDSKFEVTFSPKGGPSA